MSLVAVAFAGWTVVTPDGWRRAPELEDQEIAARIRREHDNLIALDAAGYVPTDDPDRGAMFVSSVSLDGSNMTADKIEDIASSTADALAAAPKSRTERWIGAEYVVVI